MLGKAYKFSDLWSSKKVEFCRGVRVLLKALANGVV